MKKILKKILPSFIFVWYHYLLALLGALIYRFPSRKMIIIGITGTKGKSTSVYLAGKILQEAGYKVGWISSLSINNGSQEAPNPYHMTMPGRFFIQKTLAKCAKNKCSVVIIEITSEGIKQFRHKFINFDTLVFTNLSPEHIESHGSFKKYKKTKLKIFRELETFKRKNISSKKIPKTIIANLDDKHSNCFLEHKADMKVGYACGERIKNLELRITNEERGIRKEEKGKNDIIAHNIKTDKDNSSFYIENTKFDLKLLGKFNIYNALSAISAASTLDIDLETSKQALEKMTSIAGRMEKIQVSPKQNFLVFIDLAHTPGSFKEVFAFIKKEIKPKNIISVFGAAGGGRDKWKRPEMGQIAGANSTHLILTDEDPYSENPKTILQDIAKGVKKETKNYEMIHDRKEAIKKALHMAKAGDVVLFLGKGTEATIQYKDKKIDWNEKKVVIDILNKR